MSTFLFSICKLLLRVTEMLIRVLWKIIYYTCAHPVFEIIVNTTFKSKTRVQQEYLRVAIVLVYYSMVHLYSMVQILSIFKFCDFSNDQGFLFFNIIKK